MPLFQIGAQLICFFERKKLKMQDRRPGNDQRGERQENRRGSFSGKEYRSDNYRRESRREDRRESRPDRSYSSRREEGREEERENTLREKARADEAEKQVALLKEQLSGLRTR